jgi:hypothetical protein
MANPILVTGAAGRVGAVGRTDSETNGALANHMDSYFMDPTSFSALK